MGQVVAFHARASAGCGSLKVKTAGSGGGFSSRSSSSENRKKSSAGILPRVRQLLTADGYSRPASAAADVLPPSASMISSTEASMGPEYSQFVNFVNLHETAVETLSLVGFKVPMAENLTSLGRRLRATREALEPTAKALCARIDCSTTRWSNYETGERPITLEVAIRLCDEYGLSLDWIYRNNMSTLSTDRRMKIKRNLAKLEGKVAA